MAYPVTLSAVAALSIAGAALGVQLGRGTVADIDPLHFSEAPAERFFADLVPGGYRASDVSSHPDDFWAGNINASGRPECFDCDAIIRPDGYGFVPEDRSPDAYFGEAALPEPVEAPSYEPSEVTRYANFPVTQEEADSQSKVRLEQHSGYYALETSPPSTEAGKTESAPVGM